MPPDVRHRGYAAGCQPPSAGFAARCEAGLCPAGNLRAWPSKSSGQRPYRGHSPTFNRAPTARQSLASHRAAKPIIARPITSGGRTVVSHIGGEAATPALRKPEPGGGAIGGAGPIEPKG